MDVQGHILLFCVSHVQKVSPDWTLTGIGAEIQHNHPDDGEDNADRLAAWPVADGEAWRRRNNTHRDVHHEESERVSCNGSPTANLHPPICDPFKNSAIPSSTPTLSAKMKGLLRPQDRVHWSLAEPISGVKRRPRTGLRNQVKL